jgi:deoxyguanosine kinase
VEVMNRVYFSLGSNLGDRLTILKDAIDVLAENLGTLIRSSSFYESAAIGFEADTLFLNACVIIDTHLSPSEILSISMNIENEFGRIRMNKGYQSRSLDIDILFFNEEIIDTDELRIPHPRLHERLFVLLPLNDLNVNCIHPELGLSIPELIDCCPNQPIPNVIKD